MKTRYARILLEPSQVGLGVRRLDEQEGNDGEGYRSRRRVLQGPESHENGKFAWIMDPDDNKIELWEPKLWDDKNKGA